LDRKRIRERQYILLCITGLILLSLVSCAPVKETVIIKEKEICSHHEFLQALATPGDFETALKRNQEVLSISPKSPPGDEALFNMGLVYAHPENPKKDYKKSVGLFKRLLKEFPRSTLIEEARVWIGVLEDIEKSMKVDIEIEEKKKELTK